MNESKTKSMLINSLLTNINIGNEILETVDHYIYISGPVNTHSRGQQWEMRKISTTWSTFGKLGKYRQGKKSPLALN